MNENRKVITPITFEIMQNGGIGQGTNVISFEHKTKDSRLSLQRIPGHVHDPQAYIASLEEGMKSYDRETGLVGAEPSEIPVVPIETAADAEIIVKPTGGLDTGYANFKLQPNFVEKFIDHEGRELEERECFDVNIFFTDMPTKKFKILRNEVAKIVSVVQRKFPYADFDKSTPDTARAIESEFRALTKRLPIYYFLVDYGWQMIEGKHLFVTDDMKSLPNGYIPQTGLNRTLCREWINPLLTIQKLYNLTSNQQALSVMISFSLLGTLYKLFEEAGYAPRFVLFVNGKTGSMKTTISKILFMQLRKGLESDEPRRIDADTLTSFERAVVSAGRDTTLLIDDYAPQRTAGRAREMENRIEMLIRMAGDGATKSRSNAKLEDVKGKGVKGVVVVTGEIKAKGMSSNLRCCYCHMRREDANTDAISWFQENPSAYSQLIASFTEYVAEHWDSIISHVKATFPGERKYLGTVINERRIVDSAATLRIVAEIWKDFLVKYSLASALDANQICIDMRAGILKNAIENLMVVKQEPISSRFLKAIHELILSRQIVLSEYRPNLENIPHLDGFVDEEYLYFLPEKLYVKVSEYLKKLGSPLGYEMSDLLQTLADEGIIKTHPNGKNARLFGKRIDLGGGRKIQFIEIKKVVYDAVLEGNWDFDCEGGRYT